MHITPPEIEMHRDVVVMRPSGDIDLGTAPALREAAVAAVPNNCPGLVLDLSNIGYLDSAGIRALFTIAAAIEEHRQRFALVVPADAPIRRTLTLVAIDNFVPIHTTLDEAVATFGTL